MNTANRKLGGVLIGVGGLGAALALLCCAAPWILGGALVALGLGFILKDAILMSLAAVGLLIAFAGWRLMRKHKQRRSRDAHCCTPPPQIRTSATNASGSCRR